MNRIYLAGPMTGLPEFNYPAFNAEAARLRELGWHVENPAENPDPPGCEWEGYMRMAIPQMLRCDMLALLPGVEKSRGAFLEIMIAGQLKMPMRAAASIDFGPEAVNMRMAA